ARVMELSPLSQDESNLVLGSLLGTGAVDPAVAGWLTAAAEVNPLFLEQLISMLVEDDAVRQEDGRWVAVKPLQELEGAATIRSLPIASASWRKSAVTTLSGGTKPEPRRGARAPVGNRGPAVRRPPSARRAGKPWQGARSRRRPPCGEGPRFCSLRPSRTPQ